MQGFARAAQVGGIPCLLASKWNIPIKESIILMTMIYVFMAENKVGRERTVDDVESDIMRAYLYERGRKNAIEAGACVRLQAGPVPHSC